MLKYVGELVKCRFPVEVISRGVVPATVKLMELIDVLINVLRELVAWLLAVVPNETILLFE